MQQYQYPDCTSVVATPPICTTSQCTWDGDILITGSCSFSTGVGRESTPICTEAEVDGVCVGWGPKPTGWTCTSERLETNENVGIRVVAVCCAAALPRKFVLGFDDLPTPNPAKSNPSIPGVWGQVPPSYKGFEWLGAYVINGEQVAKEYPNCKNGYTTGVVSRPNALYNGDAQPIRMSLPLPGFAFTITSLEVTAAWYNNVIVTFTGYDENLSVVGVVSRTVDQAGPRTIHLEFLDRISKLLITTASCGVVAPASCTATSTGNCFDGNRTYVAIDNIAVTGETEGTKNPLWRPILQGGCCAKHTLCCACAELLLTCTLPYT
jgi:hypothetical protein